MLLLYGTIQYWQIMERNNRIKQTVTLQTASFTTAATYSDKPTFDMYGFVQAAFDHFNRTLFDNQLSQVLLTFQREKNVMGYFSFKRWDGREGQCHEIAINPNYFITHKPLEFYQTLVHEMCHQWQYEFGTPSRRSYHNREWADKMEYIGLMPSSTGEPGGKKTGQKVSDYPIPGGRFSKECIAFTRTGLQLPYVDIANARYQSAQIRENETINSDSLGYLLGEEPSQEQQEAGELLLQPFDEIFVAEEEPSAEEDEPPVIIVPATKSKVAFQCPDCGDKAWGKPSLNIICGNCSVHLETL